MPKKRAVSSSTNAQKLLAPRWQKRRLEALEAGGWKCEACGDGKKTLHVHHKYYVRGREPWEYADYALQVLCAECHKGITAQNEGVKSVFGMLSFARRDAVLMFLVGMTKGTRMHPEPDSIPNGPPGFREFAETYVDRLLASGGDK